MKDLLRKGFLICLLVLVASVFVSCGGNKDATGGDPAGNGGTVTQQKAVFVGTDEDGTYTATFETDGTFKVTMPWYDGSTAVVMEGTYTGNAAVDGTITVTILKGMDETGNLVPYEPDEDEENPFTVTITNGKSDWDGTEYTRQ